MVEVKLIQFGDSEILLKSLRMIFSKTCSRQILYLLGLVLC